LPTVPIPGKYRFFFYSADGQEPVHIHVEREQNEAKFWLNPVRLERTNFRSRETRRIEALMVKHSAMILREWNDFFGKETAIGESENR
jgi:hypothetical protein